MGSRSKRSSKTKAGGGSAANWLCTFNDLMTLLMVFFVLLFTMGSIDTRKLKSFSGLLQAGLGVLEAGKQTQVGVVEPVRAIRTMTNDEIRDYIKGLHFPEGIEAEGSEDEIRITLDDSIFFQSGVAHINRSALPILDKITEMIRNTSHHVRVEGHTDDDPIHTPVYPSNWELSMARAVNVLKYFVHRGRIKPERFSAAGYGQSRPLYPNDTPEHKANNRRVVIILVPEEVN
ncbi:MAG: OmpA family protein [Thermodesulfobacteriota bacterium]|nr:OmpA family protein [Thermodesulfobacteriota bacterium]